MAVGVVGQFVAHVGQPVGPRRIGLEPRADDEARGRDGRPAQDVDQPPGHVEAAIGVEGERHAGIVRRPPCRGNRAPAGGSVAAVVAGAGSGGGAAEPGGAGVMTVPGASWPAPAASGSLVPHAAATAHAAAPSRKDRRVGAGTAGGSPRGSVGSGQVTGRPAAGRGTGEGSDRALTGSLPG